MKVKEYLSRIGIDEDLPKSPDSLRKIQYHHVTTVPYENLDIMRGVPLSLDEDHLFDKIVTRRRGGYCFEVNLALAALLTSLGYTVKNRFARFLRGEEGIPPRRHRVLLVECDGDVYVLDVGIGQPAPRYPLLLAEGLVQEQFGETYKFERDDFLGWVLYDLHKGEWRKFFSFTDEDNRECDFLYASYFCETHPESKSNKSNIVSIKTSTGRKTINGMDYKEFSGDELVYIEENISNKRLTEILNDEFGIAGM